MDNFNFNLFKYFYYFAYYKGFSNAARNLNVVQSALSYNVKTLENQIGKTLIIRNSKSFQLTDDGNNLFNVWCDLNETQREGCLNELVQILRKIHKPTEQKNEVIANMLLKYDEYLNRLKLSNLLSSDKIYYLNELRNTLTFYFENANFGFTHGDIHFNNIIYSDDGLKLIDFECYDIAPLDKEFD